jgi:hypothetical protein
MMSGAKWYMDCEASTDSTTDVHPAIVMNLQFQVGIFFWTPFLLNFENPPF